MKSILTILVIALGCQFASAADSNGISEITGFAEAKAAAKRGDAASAEQILLGGNTAVPGTYDWQIESAQRLMLLAYAVPREGSAVAVPALVTSMLSHTSAAEALASDARRQALAKALAGNIYENFRGDHAQALASYRAAAQLMPEHPTAKRSADRLQRLIDNLRARLPR